MKTVKEFDIEEMPGTGIRSRTLEALATVLLMVPLPEKLEFTSFWRGAGIASFMFSTSERRWGYHLIPKEVVIGFKRSCIPGRAKSAFGIWPLFQVSWHSVRE